MSFAASRYVKHLIQAPNGEKISIAEKLVLGLLSDDHNEDERCAWPSVPSLAIRACMSEVNCRRLLKKLETKGVLESMPRLRENGGRSSNGYRFPQIDPPFEAKEVAKTTKVLQLQAARAATRPVQMKLNPQHPPSHPGEGPPSTQERGPLAPKRGAPYHPGEPPPLTGERGPLSSRRGGKEPLTEPLGQPLTDQPLDAKAEPTITSPTPPQAAGCVNPARASEEASWGLMLVRLKTALNSAPASVEKRFGTIKPNERDYDACFRAWWLVGRVDEPARVVLVTEAADPETTEAGIQKYKARLDALARSLLKGVNGRQIVFEVRRAGTVDIAAAAENP